jgi:tetratricopeptide (TPR) repeat protein
MRALSHRLVWQLRKPCRFRYLRDVVSRYLFLMFFIPLFFTGCVTHQQPLTSGSETYRILPVKYKEKALDYETKGMLREAIQSWYIVLSFQPGDVQLKEKIISLKKLVQIKAADHFNKGLGFYQHGQFHNARREFLLTLAYDQDHELALDYLLKRLQQPVFRTYMVQAGDTVKTIAEKEFHDPHKDFLITTFNNVDSSRELNAGTLLQIPLFGVNFSGKEKTVQVQSQYDAVPFEANRAKNKGIETVSSKSIYRETDQDAENKKSDESSDIENYRKAKDYLEQGEYQKSLESLLLIDSDYRDVRQLKASIEDSLQQEADAHYRKGISYFLSEDLDKAIAEWEEVLRLRPGDLKAQKDLQNARRIQQKVNKY